MSLSGSLKNMIRNIVHWANDCSVYVNSESIMSTKGISNFSTLKLSIINAIGGKVVTVFHYNPVTDRSSENVYIITDIERLGEEIGQIITRESLTR